MRRMSSTRATSLPPSIMLCLLAPGLSAHHPWSLSLSAHKSDSDAIMCAADWPLRRQHSVSSGQCPHSELSRPAVWVWARDVVPSSTTQSHYNPLWPWTTNTNQHDVVVLEVRRLRDNAICKAEKRPLYQSTTKAWLIIIILLRVKCCPLRCKRAFALLQKIFKDTWSFCLDVYSLQGRVLQTEAVLK